MDGRGIFYYKGYPLQEGNWKKGLKHGSGKRFYKKSNVIEYDGDWSEGKKHGKGTLFSRDGMLLFQGHFENDAKVN